MRNFNDQGFTLSLEDTFFEEPQWLELKLNFNYNESSSSSFVCSNLQSSSYSLLHIVLLVCCLELVQVFSEYRQTSVQQREFCSIKRYLSYSLFCFYKSSNLILFVEWSVFRQLATRYLSCFFYRFLTGDDILIMRCNVSFQINTR